MIKLGKLLLKMDLFIQQNFSLKPILMAKKAFMTNTSDEYGISSHWSIINIRVGQKNSQ